ncbi:MAG: Flagellar export protein FliJ [Cyanobacteria bacterium RYN_339]|nr:Flagellar export protein FliJ [Cyanobacteria bacterium RYN_339]
MPFRYQMQKVLDLMLNREKAIDAEVMAATAARNIEQAKLDEIDMRKNAAQKGLSAQMGAGATADVAASNDYIQALNLRAEAQMKYVKAAQTVVNAASEKQTAARRERKKIEQHKEMKLKIWQAEEKKKDAKKMDEMAGTIFMKKRALNEENARDEAERDVKMEQLRLLRELREKREKKGY